MTAFAKETYIFRMRGQLDRARLENAVLKVENRKLLQRVRELEEKHLDPSDPGANVVPNPGGTD